MLHIYTIIIVVIILLIINLCRNSIRLNAVSRKLWVDHVFWTREYLIAALYNVPNVSAAATRLMKNQEDIGHMFGSYFGKDAGNTLTTLLKEHISQAVDIVQSLGSTLLPKKIAAWQDNAKKIGKFTKDTCGVDMTSMMLKHLDVTTAEVLSIEKREYDQSVIDFDAVLKEAYMMADDFASAVIQSNILTLCIAITLPCCSHKPTHKQ